MFETFRSFADYVRDYELHRAEGLLLRHLSSVHKVLMQTVPDPAKTDAVREMELYLGTMIRQVDSSLLEEWERMRDPQYQPLTTTNGLEAKPPGSAEADADVTRDAKRFTACIRTRIFIFLRAVAVGDIEEALALLVAPEDADGEPWTPERLAQTWEGYLAGHERLCLDPGARNLRHTYVLPSEDRARWIIQQMLVDSEAHNDWVAEFEVDLAASRAAGEPLLRLRRLGGL